MPGSSPGMTFIRRVIPAGAKRGAAPPQAAVPRTSRAQRGADPGPRKDCLAETFSLGPGSALRLRRRGSGTRGLPHPLIPGLDPGTQPFQQLPAKSPGGRVKPVPRTSRAQRGADPGPRGDCLAETFSLGPGSALRLRRRGSGTRGLPHPLIPGLDPGTQPFQQLPAKSPGGRVKPVPRTSRAQRGADPGPRGDCLAETLALGPGSALRLRRRGSGTRVGVSGATPAPHSPPPGAFRPR